MSVVPRQAVRWYKSGNFLHSLKLAELRGFYNASVAADSDRILRFTAYAPAAGEVMTIAQVAMDAGLPHPASRDTLITHLTTAEGMTAFYSGTEIVIAAARRSTFISDGGPLNDHGTESAGLTL